MSVCTIRSVKGIWLMSGACLPTLQLTTSHSQRLNSGL